MQKSEVFFDYREEWNDGRLQTLTAENVSVFCHVSRGIKEILKVS